MIRVGVAGFGLAGRVFHAPLIASVEGLELAGVVERQTNLAAERYPGIRTYRSFDEMLGDDSLNLLVIATPNATHVEMTRQALAAGKHVVVDKPVAPGPRELAELITLARQKNALLIPFHNRRWDGDFLTVRKLVQEGTLGRVVYLESRMERWNPGATRKPWKDDPTQTGGLLLDLGTHLVDQALELFGKPAAVWADILRERDGNGAEDSFTIRLRYDNGLRITLESNLLSSPAGARFHVRGTQGNYRKKGVDPQEAALSKVIRIEEPTWGTEPQEKWGMLHVDAEGGIITRPVETVAGDYRRYYAGVRDALLGKAQSPVLSLEAWRVASVLAWAQESSISKREIACDWSIEPA